MVHWFEDLTKTVADDKLPRRQAIRRIAGSVTGIALASLLPGQVWARADHLKKTCSTPCKDCSGGCDFNNCNGNNNCYCFFELSGKGGCGCNSFCSQVPTCSGSSKCPKGTFCVVETGCNCGSSSGVCIPYCVGKNKNCQLGSGHGPTATSHLL
jgi:hypothetical protein